MYFIWYCIDHPTDLDSSCILNGSSHLSISPIFYFCSSLLSTLRIKFYWVSIQFITINEGSHKGELDWNSPKIYYFQLLTVQRIFKGIFYSCSISAKLSHESEYIILYCKILCIICFAQSLYLNFLTEDSLCLMHLYILRNNNPKWNILTFTYVAYILFISKTYHWIRKHNANQSRYAQIYNLTWPSCINSVTVTIYTELDRFYLYGIIFTMWL